MKAVNLARILLEHPDAVVSATALVSDGTPTGLKDERRDPLIRYSDTYKCFDIQPTCLLIFRKKKRFGI